MALEILWVPLLHLLTVCIRMLRLLIIVYWIIDILLAFNTLNRNSLVVYNARNALMRLIEPLLSPIRRIIPPLGMFDFSPLVLLLGLEFLSEVIRMILVKYFSI